MASNIEWQKSLRRSVDSSLPSALARKQDKKSSRMSVLVEERDENREAFRDAACRPPVSTRSRTQRPSLTEISQTTKEPRPPIRQKSPTKKTKTESYLRKLPPPNLTLKPDLDEHRSLPSPIPLPAGVQNIDDEEDSTSLYGRDFIHYLKSRDVKLSAPMTPSSFAWCEDNRAMLLRWLMSVAHFLKTSQETWYHTVDMIDRCFSAKKFPRDKVQLVGTSCFLIATKLDEYYPADIDVLVKMTDKSYNAREITSMELEILQLLDFLSYGKDPISFVNRYIRAAHVEGDRMFYELANFFMDSLVPNLNHWIELTTDFRAAGCVLAALVIHNNSVCSEELWTRTLVYYSGWEFSELIPLAKALIQTLVKVQDNRQSMSRSKLCELKQKYTSVSRHRGLLQQSLVSEKQARKALLTVSEFS